MDTAKPSLFSLTSEWNAVLAALIDDEVDEAEGLRLIDEIEGDIAEKADNYAAIITRLEAQAAMLDDETLRCKRLSNVYKNRSDRLREMLKNAMIQTGQSKLSTNLHRFTIRNNQLVAKVDNLETALKAAQENGYIKPHTLTEADIDKTAVKEALSNGEYLEGFHAERGTSLTIK